MKSIFSNKRILTMLVILLFVITSAVVGSTFAKYATVEDVGSFNLHVIPKEKAYAVYSDTDNSLDFYYGVYPEIGTTLTNGKIVTAVYQNNIENSTSTIPEWSNIAHLIKSVNFVDEISPVSISGWFSEFTNATSFDLTNLNTEKVSDMSNIFNDCSALHTLTLGAKFGSSEQTFSDLGIDKVITGFTKYSENDVTDYLSKNISLGTADTYTAVTYCYAVYSAGNLNIYQRKYVPTVNGFHDGHKVEAVYSWRSGNSTTGYSTCEGGRPPKDANGSIRKNWATRDTNTYTKVTVVDYIKPTSLDYWFKDFRNVTIFDLSNLDTSDTESMAYMFYDANKPTVYDLRHFNTPKLKDTSYMFSKCWNLKTVYLSSFNTSNVINMTSMFDMTSSTGQTSSLVTIYASDSFVIAEETTTTKMFTKCINLIGGNGTSFADKGITNGSYARIDGGPDSDTPGYFTVEGATAFVAGEPIDIRATCSCETKCVAMNEACEICKTDFTLCIGAEAAQPEAPADENPPADEQGEQPTEGTDEVIPPTEDSEPTDTPTETVNTDPEETQAPAEQESPVSEEATPPAETSTDPAILPSESSEDDEGQQQDQQNEQE